MFKPKLSHDSQELLVQQYKHLRQRDTGGSAKSSWRITVRQLESMLRLSEAFARLHCSEEVTSRHVKEAYRLLNKSIIRSVSNLNTTRKFSTLFVGLISRMLTSMKRMMLQRRSMIPWKLIRKTNPVRQPRNL